MIPQPQDAVIRCVFTKHRHSLRFPGRNHSSPIRHGVDREGKCIRSMIIVSSLEAAPAAYKTYRPTYVISILDEREPAPPIFEALPKENHILFSEDCSRAVKEADCVNQDGRCDRLLKLADRWLQDGNKDASILIHCHQGVARSMAVAYILMCAIEKNHCEKVIAERLRKAAPHADPNLMLISEADALLHRDDRMVEAILDLCPCSKATQTPIVAFPLAT